VFRRRRSSLADSLEEQRKILKEGFSFPSDDCELCHLLCSFVEKNIAGKRYYGLKVRVSPVTPVSPYSVEVVVNDEGNEEETVQFYCYNGKDKTGRSRN